MGNRVVYHCSSQQGLTRIEPRASTHGTWVYATHDPVTAALFLSTTGGDLTCQVGRDEESGKPYLCERFAGAFELRYSGRSGSIYALPGDGFLTGQTPWDEELVSATAAYPLEETVVANAAVYLVGLAREGRLLIVRYPERVDGIPADDEDLVERATARVRRFGPTALDGLEKYHPHLVPRVLQNLGRERC